MKKQLVDGAEAFAMAATGFAVTVLAKNVASAQSLDFLQPIKDFIYTVVDDNLWALLPGAYALYHLGLFAKTFQMPMILKGVGGAAAAGIWVSRWDILGKFGVTH